MIAIYVHYERGAKLQIYLRAGESWMSSSDTEWADRFQRFSKHEFYFGVKKLTMS